MVEGIQAVGRTPRPGPVRGSSEKPPENFMDVFAKVRENHSRENKKKAAKDEPVPCENVDPASIQPQEDFKAEEMDAELVEDSETAKTKTPLKDVDESLMAMISAPADVGAKGLPGVIQAVLNNNHEPINPVIPEAAPKDAATDIHGNSAMSLASNVMAATTPVAADLSAYTAVADTQAAVMQLNERDLSKPGMVLSEGSKKLSDGHRMPEPVGMDIQGSKSGTEVRVSSGGFGEMLASKEYLLEHQQTLKQAVGSGLNSGAQKFGDGLENKGLVDVDKLQAQVNDSDYMDGRLMISKNLYGNAGVWKTMEGSADSSQTASVLGQLQNGIGEGIKKGMSQFTIRLKPEGLGELVIRMTDVGGRITMSIGASQLETQRILNSELTDLRQQMQSLNVQVGEIYHSDSGGLDMMNFQNNGSLWQHDGNYHSGGGKHSGGSFDFTEEDALQDTALVGNGSVLPDGQLDTYI